MVDDDDVVNEENREQWKESQDRMGKKRIRKREDVCGICRQKCLGKKILPSLSLSQTHTHPLFFSPIHPAIVVSSLLYSFFYLFIK